MQTKALTISADESKYALAAFRCQGFATLNVLSASEYALAQQAFNDDPLIRANMGTYGDAESGIVYMFIVNECPGSPTLANIARRQTWFHLLVASLESIGGKTKDHAMRLVHFKSVSKDTVYPGDTKPHTDFSYWEDPKYGFIHPAMLTFGVCLSGPHYTEVGRNFEQPGAVQFVAGSHNDGYRFCPRREPGGQQELAPEYVDAYLKRTGKSWQPAHLAGGQGVIFDSRVLHWAPAPPAGGDERVMWYTAITGAANTPVQVGDTPPRHSCNTMLTAIDSEGILTSNDKPVFFGEGVEVATPRNPRGS